MIWQRLLSENIARAVWFALVHSLWQGMLIGVVAALIVLLTKKSPAARRCVWFTGLLGLFTLSFFVTLAIELNGGKSGGQYHSGVSAAISRLLDAGLALGQDHAPMIVSCWLLIIVLRSLWLLLGFFSLGRMERTRVQPPGPDWEALLARLAGVMGITGVVTLLESAITKIPLTVGYLKPVILIPAGILTGLGQQEVEMILLHELAHVLRKDYVINLLQNLVETVFFFHPVALWLSARIRTEREHCVDDLVIKKTGNQRGYVKALVHYEQYRAAAPAFTLAFAGRGTLGRLERIISRRNKALHKWELFGLALLLVIGALIAGFRPGRIHAHPTTEKAAFEAKRKAEAEALGRQQPSQPH